MKAADLIKTNLVFTDGAKSIVECAECLEFMRRIPDNSIDLVFGSPPYEAARTYGIDFSLKGQAWVDWMSVRMIEMVRISKGLVAMVVEGQTRQFKYSAAPVLLMADLHRKGITLRKPPIFHRVGIPGSGGPDWLRNDYEFVVCCTGGGKLPWSDNTAMGHPPKWGPGGEMSHRVSNGTRRNQWGAVGSKKGMGAKDKHGRARRTDRPSHFVHTKADGTEVVREARQVMTRDRDGTHAQTQVGYTVPAKANPGNVIKCIVGGGVMGSKLAHENEAPFPESLAEFFVRSFCPPSGTVYDPFSGSGTTGAVCLKSDRQFVGTDIRESQVELTKRRIREIQRELFSTEEANHG